MKIRRESLAAVVTTVVLVLTLPFIMAPTPCNLKVAGHPGSSEKEGRQDTSDVFEFRHSLSQPFDPATGLPMGPRQHSPFKVVKLIDKATPGFHKALARRELIPTVEVFFYRIDPSTREEAKYYTITLTNARIVDVGPFMPMSFVPQNESYRHMEEVSFVYEEIEWNWLPDSVVEADTWIGSEP